MSSKYLTPRPSNEVAGLPTYSFVKDIVDLQNDGRRFLPGDELWMPLSGLDILAAKVLPSPSSRSDYGNPKIKLTLNVLVDGISDLQDFLTDALYGTPSKLRMRYIHHELISTSESYCKVDVVGLVEDCTSHNHSEVVFSPRFDNIWNRYMNALVKEGACYGYNKVDTTLYESLRKNFTDVADNTPIDYHPNSNGVVRDLVHPALYSYIEGVSKVNESSRSTPVLAETLKRPTDYWGGGRGRRKYSEFHIPHTKFQWLPTAFIISPEGKASISGYINNLDQENFVAMYRDLEKLFDVFLPYFEEVWSYIQSTAFFEEDSDVDSDDMEYDINEAPQIKPGYLRGRELQVIVKMVEYSLGPGQSYEGDWHVEGMPKENIVMTGIFLLDRDTDLVGGDLDFKRELTLLERNHLRWNIAQYRPAVINDFASEGFAPMGYFPTEEGYILVYPNCHISKISKLLNTSSSKKGCLRTIVFFVVNPHVSITSTREVPRQQNVISQEQAEAYRLELMTEYSKVHRFTPDLYYKFDF